MAVPPHAFPEHNRDIPHGGNTALMFAARSGDVDSARLLIEAGADVDDQDAWGVSATTLAAHSGYADLVELLLEAGADPDADAAGFAALHEAVMRRDMRLVTALLEHGADPNVRLRTWTPKRRTSADHNFSPALVGATPLWLAARFAEPRLMRLLIDDGADPLFVHDIEYQQDYRRGAAGRPHEVTTAIMAATGMGGDVGRAWIRPNAHRTQGGGLRGCPARHRAGCRRQCGQPVRQHRPTQRRGAGATTTSSPSWWENGAELDVENAAGETPLRAAQARGRGWVHGRAAGGARRE